MTAKTLWPPRECDPKAHAMMASTREAPPTPISSRSHRAGGRGPSVALEARQAMGGDDAAPPTPPAESPARRHTPFHERMMASTCEAPNGPTTPVSFRSSHSSQPVEESERRSSARARSRSEFRDPGAVLAARYKRVWSDPGAVLAARYKSVWGVAS